METFVTTVLPVSADPGAPFHLSLHIAPRLESGQQEIPLTAFALFVNWPAVLTGRGGVEVTVEIEARGARTPHPAAVVSKPDPEWWNRVFDGTVVRPPNFRPLSARRWLSFDAVAVDEFARGLHAAQILASPAAPVPSPAVAGRASVLGGLRQVGDFAGWERGWLDELIARTFGEGEPVDRTPDPVDPADAYGTVQRALAELHRARRFFDPPETDGNAWRAHPDHGATLVPPGPLDPDFHERVAGLGDLAPLLRSLGLVLDLHLEPGAIDELQEGGTLRARLMLPQGAPQPDRQYSPRTAYVRRQNALVVPGIAGGDEKPLVWCDGQLRVGGPDFRVLQADVDAAALKLDRFLATFLGRVDTASTNDATPPAQVGAGLSVSRRHRDGVMHETLQRAEARRTDEESGASGEQLNPLFADDIARGYRVEVWDEQANRRHWRSLHERNLTITVAGHTLDGPHPGFVAGTSAWEDYDDDSNGPLHLHGSLFGWQGWSLSAGHPALPAREPGAGDATPEPVTPVVVTSEPALQTLPRLRYGRAYRLRAWMVDLAGNCVADALRRGPVAVDWDAVDPADPDQEAIDVAAAALQNRTTGNSGLDNALRQVLKLAVPEPPAAFAAPTATDLDPIVVGRQDLDQVILDRLVRRSGATLAARRRSDVIADELRGLVHGTADLQIVPPPDHDTPDALAVQGQLQRTTSGQPLAHAVDEALEVTTRLITYLRWEPVGPPVFAAKTAYGPGESADHLVVRSTVSWPDDAGEPTIHPDGAAACVRHLVSPRGSVEQAERHGCFDVGPVAAIGSRDSDVQRGALRVAVREDRSLYDDASARVVSSQQNRSSLDDLRRGEAVQQGEYVVFDTDALVVPYLADPAAAGVTVAFQPSGAPSTPIGIDLPETRTVAYPGAWPDHGSLALQLARAEPERPGVEVTTIGEHRDLTVALAPGRSVTAQVSSSLDDTHLEHFGWWQTLPEPARELATLRQASLDGLLWSLTPAQPLTLVHAVDRPVQRPHLIDPSVARVAGATSVSISALLTCDAASTTQIDLHAEWAEVDDTVDPDDDPGGGPVTKPSTSTVRQVVGSVDVADGEDLVVVSTAAEDPGKPASPPPQPVRTVDVGGIATVRVHRLVHRLGDTRHRRITYRPSAVSRYREHFPHLGAEATTVDGSTVELSVPSTAPPPGPDVESVEALFRWPDTRSERFAIQRTRLTGIRVVLARGWFASGEDERLGVVVSTDPAKMAGSTWGADPLWAQVGPPTSALRLVDLDRLGDAPTVDLGVDGDDRQTALLFAPVFNRHHRRWTVDVPIDPGPSLCPFVSLVLCRYQSESVPGCTTSTFARCDFLQLTPTRTATVVRSAEDRMTVSLAGPVGIGTVAAGAANLLDGVGRERRVLVRIERRRRARAPDDSVTGWETFGPASVLRLAAVDPATGLATWRETLDGRFAPGEGGDHRLAIEESERLPADPMNGRDHVDRVVYADHIPLAAEGG